MLKMTTLFIKRILILHLGLVLYALGIAITLQAQIGFAPWDVLHFGLAKTLGISFGTVSVIIGFFIILFIWFFGENIGIGTIANMIVIGMAIDLFIFLDFIPKAINFPIGVLMLVCGLFVTSLATYFYIRSGFGAGPRDTLMVLLTRKTGFPVGACRAGIELSVILLGWSLGGLVGLGTVISAFAIGFCIQITFKILHFDPTLIKHETMQETFMAFKKGTARL